MKPWRTKRPRRFRLSSGDQSDLAVRAKAGDSAAEAELVASMARWSKQVCFRYRNIPGFDMNDAMADAAIGVMRSVKTFDASKGLTFSCYATHWINTMVGRGVRSRSGSLRIPESTWMQHRETALGIAWGGVSLDADRDDDNARAGYLGAQDMLAIADANAEPPDVAAMRSERVAMARRMLAKLPERDRGVLLARFGGQTLAEVGEAMGIVRERVRQIEARALTKLREMATQEAA